MNQITSRPARSAKLPLAAAGIALVLGGWLAYQANTALQALQQLATEPTDALAAAGVNSFTLKDQVGAADVQLWLGLGLLALAVVLLVLGLVRLRRPT